jgi:hypothetical protein
MIWQQQQQQQQGATEKLCSGNLEVWSLVCVLRASGVQSSCLGLADTSVLHQPTQAGLADASAAFHHQR